jgi:hypothetical protein
MFITVSTPERVSFLIAVTWVNLIYPVILDTLLIVLIVLEVVVSVQGSKQAYNTEKLPLVLTQNILTAA